MQPRATLMVVVVVVRVRALAGAGGGRAGGAPALESVSGARGVRGAWAKAACCKFATGDLEGCLLERSLHCHNKAGRGRAPPPRGFVS